MALDEWLLEQHRQGNHPATLRFYTWSPVAISLGHHQRRYPEAWHRLIWKNKPVDLVRRPSGGRAVLHQGDLTYAVIASGFPQNRMQAYQRLCQFLISGWRSLGLNLQYGEAGRGYIHNANCFGTATAADLVLPDGTKLIGSAQLRWGGAILQHGSIRLEPDSDLFAQVFGEAAKVGLPLNLPLNLSLNSPYEALLQTVIETLTEAAQQEFEMKLVSQPLSDAEWQAVLERAERFRSVAG